MGELGVGFRLVTRVSKPQTLSASSENSEPIAKTHLEYAVDNISQHDHRNEEASRKSF